MQTGLRATSAGIPCALLLGIEAIGFPTSGLRLGTGALKGTPVRDLQSLEEALKRSLQRNPKGSLKGGFLQEPSESRGSLKKEPSKEP